MRWRFSTLFGAILDKYPGANERVRMRQPVQGEPLTLEGLKWLGDTLGRVRKTVTDPEHQVEVDAARSGAGEMHARLETVLLQKREEAVYWMEIDRGTGRLKPETELFEETVDRKRHRVSLNMAPLSVAEALQNTVYQQTGTVIFVSATLSVAGEYHRLLGDTPNQRTERVPTGIGGQRQPNDGAWKPGKGLCVPETVL